MNTLDAQHVPLPESRTSPLLEETVVDPEIQKTEPAEGIAHEEVAGDRRPQDLTEGREESEDEVDGMVGNGRKSPDGGYQDSMEESSEGIRGQGHGGDDDQEPDGVSAPHPSSLPDSSIRPPTPSSRTSTPPLGGASSVPSVKKFSSKVSSISINKRFLSKTASPAGGSPAAASKLGLSATSPVPIASSSSRLLSTKLTTVPSSKSSTSPQPPGSTNTSTPSTSPWAKPPPAILPENSETSPIPSSTLHHPAPTRARVLTSTPAIVMGTSQALSGINSKTAWKAVAPEGKRSTLGLSRDFPTAKEVADHKRAQQMAAQAQAAHNQAILQGLNAFTRLDPSTHHWDDEDEDDDIIDFGDGSIHPHHDHPLSIPGGLPDHPVPKSERFVEDFDRSWPRQKLPVVELGPSPSTGLPRRPDSDRVLFNASSNRLEPSLPRQNPLPPQQPTRLMTRPEAAPAGRSFDRPIPPHLLGGQPESGRMLPPHMSTSSHPVPPSLSQQPSDRSPQQAASIPGSIRQPWGSQRENERPLHRAPEHKEPLPQQSSNQPPAPTAYHQGPRGSFSQNARPVLTVGATSPETEPSSHLPGAVPVMDNQTAEMHNAAEKARLRRLAEEQEREAAAERARRKAKELEERFGLKDTPKSYNDANIATRQTAPPGLAKPQTGSNFVIAQRPQPLAEQEAAYSRSGPVNNEGGLPIRPQNEAHADGSWRARLGESRTEASSHPSSAQQARQAPGPSPGNRSIPLEGDHAANIIPDSFLAPAESGVSPQSPGKPPAAKEKNFDNMLARIQAAMAEARATPITSPPDPLEPESSGSLEPSEVAPKSIQQAVESPQKVRANDPISVQYFDVTQPELPRSPPPAWRTYTVKMPKVSYLKSPIAQWRIKAFDAPRKDQHKGLIMSYEPAIENLSFSTLSLSELLLPQPLQRPFAKQLDVQPIVSISPRRFEPFARKPKKKVSYDIPRSTGPTQPVTPAESLLPDAPSSASARLRSQIAPIPTSGKRWDDASQTVPTDAPHQSRSPATSTVSVKAERDGGPQADGLATSVPDRSRSLSDLKPGVRFMVSSELLDGDSLLKEVNKMSLESLGDGDDKVDELGEVGEAKTTGSETPKTPPSHSGTSSRGLAPSPNGTTTTPWSKTPTRSTSQHDQLRSVWEQTPALAVDGSSRATDNFSAPTPTNAPVSGDAPTPMYPSLNAPSSSDPPAAQPLPSTMKLGYPHTQPFSPPVATASTFSTVRQSPAPYGYSNAEQNLAYQRNALNGAVNGGYGAQQGVWSSSAFGTGYGYSKSTPGTSSLDSKAALAFHAAPSKDGMTYPNANVGDYRYANNHPSYTAYHTQTSQQQSPGAYGQSSYGRQNVTSPPGNMYGYAYGAPGTQTNTNARARFGAANGNEYQYSGAGMEGGYYGGVGAGQQQQAQSQQALPLHQQQQQAPQHHHQQAYTYAGHGAIGQHQSQGRVTGTGANAGAVGGGRKWGQ